MRLHPHVILVLLALIVPAGCGNRRAQTDDDTCDLTAPSCSEGLVCGAVQDAEAPVTSSV